MTRSGAKGEADKVVYLPSLPGAAQAGGSHKPNSRPRRHTRAAGGNLAPSYHRAAPDAPGHICAPGAWAVSRAVSCAGKQASVQHASSTTAIRGGCFASSAVQPALKTRHLD